MESAWDHEHLTGPGDPGVAVTSVVFQVPAATPDRPPQVVEARTGDVLRFGRGAAGTPVDLVLDHPAVSRVAGELHVVDDHWRISNLSTDDHYVVDNPEGGGEYLSIPPRRLEAPVPFEFARVALPVPGGTVSFLATAPDHAYADAASAETDGGGPPTAAAFSLDESAKYFLVLVALCEPRLRDSATVALPTADQIVDRLREHPAGAGLTRAAVNHHIDYVATTKLHVKEPDLGTGDRLDHKREALVAVALRFGLVRDDHRRLLRPRTGGSG